MAGKPSPEAESLLAVVPLLDEKDPETILQGAATVASSQTVEHQLVNPVRVRRHNDPMDLVQLAESVMKADQFVRATTGGKLMVIVEQIRALQDQAKEILVTAKRDAQLHHAACNFTKIPGHIYHLYEREDESCYFSMLSPQDWGKQCPHKHVGSYRLEHDHSWTLLEEVEKRSKDIEAINRIIDAHALPSTAIQYHSTRS